jgi:integrase
MSNTQKPKANESDWKKVASCLYRYRGGTYYALLKIRGKQVKQSLETSDREMANRKLRELRAKLEKTNPALARRTLAEHRALFEALLTGAASTIESHKHHIRQLVERWPSDSPDIISKITKTHVAKWLKLFSDEALEASSINKRITSLRKFFDMAVDDGVIAEDDTPMVRIKYGKPADPIRLTPTEEQFRALVDDIRSQKSNGHGCNDSADFVELAGTLGLGQAELSGICRQDINLKTNKIQLFRRKSKQQFTIPIFPDARPIIERRLANTEDFPDARLLPQDNCKKALEGACRRLNFPHFEPRSLRRFHITRSLRAGIDAPTVGAWQGHKDGGKLVLKVYQAEVNDSHSQRMAAMLGAKPENVVMMPTERAAG